MASCSAASYDSAARNFSRRSVHCAVVQVSRAARRQAPITANTLPSPPLSLTLGKFLGMPSASTVTAMCLCPFEFLDDCAKGVRLVLRAELGLGVGTFVRVVKPIRLLEQRLDNHRDLLRRKLVHALPYSARVGNSSSNVVPLKNRQLPSGPTA